MRKRGRVRVCSCALILGTALTCPFQAGLSGGELADQHQQQSKAPAKAQRNNQAGCHAEQIPCKLQETHCLSRSCYGCTADVGRVLGALLKLAL